ncbi:MAG TPA: hypothetical protein VMU18_07745 [Rhodoblastus sp.]|nr:hypothetical protein [Rhodoblastus sp.]
MALVALFAGAPAALAASADPCAKFKEADAYNNCLARSGPLFHEGHFSRPPPAADGAEAVSARDAPKAEVRRGKRRRDAGPSRRHRRHSASGSHGRVRLEIYPGR